MPKFPKPGALNSDEFGNLPPSAGGTVAVLTKAIDFNDTTDIEVGTLYPGSVHVGTKVVVLTAWDSATSDALTVGTSGDTDLYVNDLDLQTAGTSRDGDTNVPSVANLTRLDTETSVVANVASAGGSLTQGSALIVVTYIRRGD